MKHQFVITNLSCWKSDKDDAAKLIGELKTKYSKLNCKITFKRVIDLTNKKIETDSKFMHCGNTNVIGLVAFNPHINGIKESENGKYFLDSEKIIKGVVLEIEYTEKKVIGKKVETHLVPTGPIKIIGYINVEKAKKVEDKVTALF
jgi:hypothetical protein